jgi:hypothetical protein
MRLLYGNRKLDNTIVIAMRSGKFGLQPSARPALHDGGTGEDGS